MTIRKKIMTKVGSYQTKNGEEKDKLIEVGTFTSGTTKAGKEYSMISLHPYINFASLKENEQYGGISCFLVDVKPYEEKSSGAIESNQGSGDYSPMKLKPIEDDIPW